MPLIAGVDLGRRRGPFLSSIELLVLAGIVSTLLVFLFPGRDFENPVHLARPDELSIAYLRMLLRAHPEDAEARLLLVQQQKAVGRLEDAHETLSQLQPSTPEMAARAEVVTLSLDRARLVAMDRTDPRRDQLQRETHAAARRLIVRTSKAAELADLADFVLSIGDPAEAAKAYRRLAGLDRDHRLGWLEKAARWSEASGQPGTAARLYAEVALASDPKEGPRLARLAMRALTAANEGKPGLAVAKPLIEKFPRDLELLERGVRMAVSTGDLTTARRWGEQRVEAAGSSTEALREQVDILLKAGDPAGGLQVAKLLLERFPDDPALRRQMAQLARWSGKPEESMEHWSWLARHGSDDARDKALELAKALNDSNREIEMLELSLRKVRRMAPPPMGTPGGRPAQAPGRNETLVHPRALPGGGVLERRRPRGVMFELRVRGRARGRARARAGESCMTDLQAGRRGLSGRRLALADRSSTPQGANNDQLGELIALADAFENKGLPERAIKALDSLRFNFAERPEYWSRLARLYENTGELERALACHEQLSRLKAMTLDDSVRQAQLLWRLQRPEAALTRLVALRGQARETDRAYFALLGDLAWRLEEHVLSAEAYGALWKTQKRAEIAERLYHALEAINRPADAVTVAEEAYDRLGLSGFLVSAVDLSLKAGDQARARRLFEKVKGREERFSSESHFWFQRAQLAAHEGRASDAERDFQRVVRIDPRSEDAYNEWLTLAVHVQDRGMARRALESWGPGAERNEESWPLLADAYSLVGENARAERFRAMIRSARARERAASGRPLTPDEQLEEAIERKDLVAVEARLRIHGRSLSLPMRVAALRELGRDWEAWRLLEAAGLTDDKSLIASEDAAALVSDVRDLREQYLSGAWLTGGIDQMGPLEIRTVGGRFELRASDLLFGMELSAGDLWALPETRLLPHGRREQRARATARLREKIGETSLRAGAEFLPDGYRPFLQLEQLISVRDGKFELRAAGSFNEVPNNTPLLRTAAVRDGFDADVTLGLGRRFEIVAGTNWSRFSTRTRYLLTTEVDGHGELAFRLPVGSAYLRPRVDGFHNWAPPVTGGIPPDLRPYLTQMENQDDLLSLEYSTAGVGLTIGSTHADVGEGRGPHVSLRYHLDGWAGHMWPARKPSYNVSAAVGLVFAQHQELAVSAFYFTDLRSAAGERYAGASLNYTLRWFR